MEMAHAESVQQASRRPPLILQLPKRRWDSPFSSPPNSPMPFSSNRRPLSADAAAGGIPKSGILMSPDVLRKQEENEIGDSAGYSPCERYTPVGSSPISGACRVGGGPACRLAGSGGPLGLARLLARQ